MTNIHPKVKGSAIGSAIGVLIIALAKLAGVHVDAGVAGAISTIIGFAIGWFTPVPAPAVPPVASPPPYVMPPPLKEPPPAV